MISRYDKNHNRISKLEKSKWTSLEKLNGWKHYEVIEIDKKNDKVELFAVCDRGKRVVVKTKDLKNKALWKRGWNSKSSTRSREYTLMDQLIDGAITRGQAAKEVKQIARRKAEKKFYLFFLSFIF